MNRKQMGTRLIRRRARGQMIPLIALMIVVLVAMVGLSVDVGNTFAEERRAVAASNAASLAAMDVYLERTTSSTDESVYKAIENSFKANGIDLATNESLEIEAVYLDVEGAPITSRNPKIVPMGNNTLSNDVGYIQIALKGTVDTYFARVVNRPTLPINATSYAGKCPAGIGVYPIGINVSDINSDFTEFVDKGAGYNWQKLTSGPYAGKTKRRLYVHDDTTSGNFSWLRWTLDAKNAPDLANSLGDVGNLADGFQEVVPWPNGSLPKPPVYPEKPGELNVGDWVHVSTGWKSSNAITGIMDGHMANGTKMILPIYDVNAGSGSNGTIHVVAMGLFVITAQDKTPGRGPYFDMVFLGRPQVQEQACVATPPQPSDEVLNLVGSVEMQPQWPDVPKSYKPVQYVVVFDVSGSMNMNFDGKGFYNGQVIQCTNGPPGAPPAQDCGQPSHAWSNVSERRITVAKEAIEYLIRRTNMPGNSSYDATRPKDTMALVWFNDKQPNTWIKSWSNDPNVLAQAVLDANKQGNDPFKSAGGTNGAAGLYRAADFLQQAPKDTTELGQKWDYKRVVVFLTDGVSNSFLDPTKSDLSGGSSGFDTYPRNPDHFCRTLGNNVRENALCQTTGFGGPYTAGNKNWDRPITQMVKTSQDKIQNNAAVNGQVYVLALSSIPETGLKDGVASPNAFFSLPSMDVDGTGLNSVERAMKEIVEDVKTGVCIPTIEQWTGIYPQGDYKPIASDGLAWPNVGWVQLKDSSGTPIDKKPIVVGTDGKMSYEFTDLPRGIYTLTGYLWYKHPKDTLHTSPLLYSNLYYNDELTTAITAEIERPEGAEGFSYTVTRNFKLKPYTDDICAAGGE